MISGPRKVHSVTTATFSLAGRDRENFDSVAGLTWSDGTTILAIADGVGSSSRGGEAARLAVETCVNIGQHRPMSEIFAEVDSAISRAAVHEEDKWNTTLSVCLISGGKAQVGHVGDTRIYHLRGRGLVSRTKDQTEVARLVEEGVISVERAARYPRRNVLLSSLNGLGDYELYQTDFGVLSGDRILLMSDGVYRRILKREFIDMSSMSGSSAELVESLKVLLLARGLIDDSSMLCADISDALPR